MTRWEYRRFNTGWESGEAIATFLNNIGEKGWEVVHMEFEEALGLGPGGVVTRRWMIFAKRPLPPVPGQVVG